MPVSRTRIAILRRLSRLKKEHKVALGAGAALLAIVPQVHNATVASAATAQYQQDLQQPQPVNKADTTLAARKAAIRATAQSLPVVRTVHPMSAAEAAAQRYLSSRIDALGASFNGDVGIAVQDVQTGWTTDYDGMSRFPQQSVSKFWVSLTAMNMADRGLLNLDAPVTMRKSDLTLFNQPIAALIDHDGYQTTLNNLIYRAITASDNTCNDFVLWRTGGPDAVREFLYDKGIQGVRFGPGERVMQARIAGMEWNSSMVGAGFYRARSALPMSVRQSALRNYLADPVDGATPLGTVEALARLKKGELLSPASTSRILSIMSNTKTGKQRLRGGLAPGYSLAHKTGTGQVLGPVSTGYNDIGIVTGPDGRSYSVAVFIKKTSAPVPQRMKLMQDTVRAVIDYSRQTQGLNFARHQPIRSQPAAPVATYAAGAAAEAIQSLEEEDGD
ncbi:MAG: Beta-lactamase [uncultured Sphingosinicella sp.]|uniref:beta-lactamase n=1 Tax=uncultured Sphingosinicella sp. TaxID=478748 RepID=A0A6J4TXT1_9SPHN|nr:serine hydrolase [uncultured Sphingosinicella sp.]CAA9535323.1 MAG: Beta-lactamase [uncultured Sphingosinicella sp.]